MTIPFHRKWFGHRLNNSLNCFAGLWTFLHLKDVRISLHNHNYNLLLFWSYVVVLRVQFKARAILLVFKKIYSCLFIPDCTWNHVITYTNHIPQKNLSTVFNPLTAKIWLLILPSSFYTFLCKMVMRIWWSIKVISCTWWVWVFSLPVCQIMYEHCREKLRVNHFWELKGLNKTFQNLFQLL